METNKQYLGDGAYVAFDGFGIVLTAEDGIRASDTIVLDPEMVASLIRYVGNLNDGGRGLVLRVAREFAFARIAGGRFAAGRNGDLMPNNWTPSALSQQNTAKQNAIRILWEKREQMVPNGTASKILTNAMDHLMTPEQFS